MSDPYNQQFQQTTNPSLPPVPPPAYQNCDVDKSKQVHMPMMIAPGNHERAWNDPPMLAAGGAKPSGITKLNKRVAFPLSSPAAAPFNPISPPMMISQPPLPAAPGPGGLGYSQPEPFVLPPSQFVPTANVSFTPYAGNPGYYNAGAQEQVQESHIHNDIKNESGPDSKEQVMSILRRSVEDSAMEVTQKDEVHKRLDMLDANWNQVEQNLKVHLGQLTNCLNFKDYMEADRIQMQIGQDYMSQHSSWILALRNVIRVLLTMQQQQQEQPVLS